MKLDAWYLCHKRHFESDLDRDPETETCIDQDVSGFHANYRNVNVTVSYAPSSDLGFSPSPVDADLSVLLYAHAWRMKTISEVEILDRYT